MLPFKRPAIFLTLTTLLLASLTACANSPVGKNLEQSLAADPQLKDNPVALGQPVTDPNRQTETQAELPADFPSEIPRYPNAKLQEVNQPTSQSAETPSGQGQVTRWSSSDSSNLVQSFYQKQFQDNNWQILSQPTDNQTDGKLVARRNDLQVTVAIQPNQNIPNQSSSSNATEFTIEYVRDSNQTAVQTPENTATATPETSPSNSIEASASPTVAAQSTATPEANNNSNQSSSSNETQVFSDLNKAPQELRSYIAELAELGVLPLTATGAKSNLSTTSNQFEANKTISRREFARWLVAVNNKFYANNPSKQIRLATQTSQPAFQDVPRTDPDFPAIQSLAEAGLIPNPLTGDSIAVLFRPDAPLTREQMLLWKVPLDTRQSLPTATFDSVKQTWGFQDVMKIDPKALKAVLADFQNGESSNIRRVFGFTTLFQPKKPVTRAEAAATLWYFGTQSEGISAKEGLQLKRQSN